MIECFLTILSVLLFQLITLTFVIFHHSNPYHFVKNWLLNVIDSPKSPLVCQWIIKYFYQYSRIWKWSNQLPEEPEIVSIMSYKGEGYKLNFTHKTLKENKMSSFWVFRTSYQTFYEEQQWTLIKNLYQLTLT